MIDLPATNLCTVLRTHGAAQSVSNRRDGKRERQEDQSILNGSLGSAQLARVWPGQ